MRRRISSAGSGVAVDVLLVVVGLGGDDGEGRKRISSGIVCRSSDDEGSGRRTFASSSWPGMR